MSELSIFTFNIRRDFGDDGINNWDRRRELVAGMLDRHGQFPFCPAGTFRATGVYEEGGQHL